MSVNSYLLTAHSHGFLSKLREKMAKVRVPTSQGLADSTKGQKEV
jgi:hypothetical protein